MLKIKEEKAHRYLSSLGFTLIEMLVSITMFGVVMSSLMTGLWVASEAHRRIFSATAFAAECAEAERLFASDFAALYLDKSQEVFPLKLLPEEGVLLDFFKASVGAYPLVHVQYILEERNEGNEKNDKETVLLRRSAVVILDSPAPPYTKQTVITKIDHVEVQYYNGKEWKENSDAMDDIPIAFRLCIWRKVRGRDHYLVLIGAPTASGEQKG